MYFDVRAEILCLPDALVGHHQVPFYGRRGGGVLPCHASLGGEGVPADSCIFRALGSKFLPIAP